MQSNEEAFSEAVSLLRSSRWTVVFTGAGVSAESGIPTFRDQLSSLWEQYDPEQLATPAAFRRDPNLVWGWYEWRRALAANARPNPAHLAIAALERYLPHLKLITQNVDDLHERAGSSHTIHLHGSLDAPRCFACARPFNQQRCVAGDTLHIPPPRCMHCNGRIRPGVVWFGEMLPRRELQSAFQAAKACDLLLSVGTSGLVYPAARIPEIARMNGAKIIHINPESAEVSGDCLLRGSAATWMPNLIAKAFL